MKRLLIILLIALTVFSVVGCDDWFKAANIYTRIELDEVFLKSSAAIMKIPKSIKHIVATKVCSGTPHIKISQVPTMANSTP